MENALPRTWSLCMTSENHGTVGPAGCTFSHAPDKHERVLVAEVPAAANKAAEEGGLPVLPHTTYNGYSDGSEPLWTKEQMHGYARQAIAADRASREVANKAEVEPAAWLIEPTSVAHKGMKREVQFDRPMVLKSDFTVTPLYATPPATTGASTVLTDERTAALIEARDAVSEMRNHLEAFGQYGVETARAALDGAVDTIDELIGDVAAQAGQVALPGWINVDERLPENGKDVIILYWPYNNHENERVAGTAHHVEGTFYDEDGNDMHPPSHWMPFVIPAAAPSPAKESK